MNQQQDTQEQHTNTPPPKPSYKFRPWIILTPICLGVLIYILANSDCVLSWQGILDNIGIVDQARFTRLFVFMLLLTAIVVITKIRKED